MKMIIAASIAVFTLTAQAREATPAMSSEVYELLSTKIYWEDAAGSDAVHVLNGCFEGAREKGKSGKSLLRSVDSCMAKAGFEKKQLESEA